MVNEALDETVHDSPSAELIVGGSTIAKGSRVKLRPTQRADIMDLALRDRIAIVDSIQTDLEQRTYVVVRLEDDPGHDLAARIGERYFFTADEVEPLDGPGPCPPPRVLVAGIGNVFSGDDGFGVEVVHKLRTQQVPPNVDVVDFGIRGMDLVYALSAGYRAAVLVDAAPRGESAGTVSLIEPELDDSAQSLDAHRVDPVAALRQARQCGPLPERVLLVACEPGAALATDEQDMAMELSDDVRAAVDEAVDMLGRVLGELTQPQETEGGAP